MQTIKVTERISTYSVVTKLNSTPCNLSVNGFAMLPNGRFLGRNIFETIAKDGGHISVRPSQRIDVEGYLFGKKDYTDNLRVNTVNTLRYFSNYTDF
jgi:hypothetical protein